MPVVNQGRLVGITYVAKCWTCGWKYEAGGTKSGYNECEKAAATHHTENHGHFAEMPSVKEHHQGLLSSLFSLLGI